MNRSRFFTGLLVIFSLGAVASSFLLAHESFQLEVLAYDIDSLVTDIEAPPKIIAYGQLKRGKIEEVGEADTFVFDGAEGDKITLRCTRWPETGSLWPRIELYEDGKLVGGSTSSPHQARVDYKLLSGGEHDIVVRDGLSGTLTGKYSLVLEKVSGAEGTPIACGDSKQSKIKPLGDIDLFHFDGKSGDTVFILATKVEGDLWPRIELYDPNGELIDSDYDSVQAQITYTLATTGRFGIVISDGLNGTLIGTYRLELECL